MERLVGSVRGTRWTVGLGAGHMVARRARRSRRRSSRCTVAVESRGLAGGRVKDRLGDQRGGSEWEPIKILLEGD
jgi:hypothetical protein